MDVRLRVTVLEVGDGAGLGERADVVRTNERDLARAIAEAQAQGGVVVVGPNEIAARALEAGADEVVTFDERDGLDIAMARAAARAKARAARDARRVVDLARADGAALELLAGSIANALSSPLAVVSLNLELLRESVGRLRRVDDALADWIGRASPEDERRDVLAIHAAGPTRAELEPALEDALTALRSAANVVRETSALAGVGATVEPDDACLAVRRVEELMRGTIEKVADFEVDHAAIVALVSMPRWQLVQVLAALLSNAHRAVVSREPRGTIRLTSRVDAGRIHIHVIDNGTGASDDVRARAFDPFFTTRGPGALGLGLTLAAARARHHGGSLDLFAEPGGGLSARLMLPLAPSMSG